MSSPSWHSFTVVKPGSSAPGTGDTRGGAGGGGEQLPQHSPSAEPSERLLASRAKPGWRRGVGVGGWGFPNPRVFQEFNRGSGDGCVPGFLCQLVQHLSHSSRSVLSLSASPKPTCVPLSPVSNLLPHVSLNIPPCPTPLPGFGEEQD